MRPCSTFDKGVEKIGAMANVDASDLDAQMEEISVGSVCTHASLGTHDVENKSSKITVWLVWYCCLISQIVHVYLLKVIIGELLRPSTTRKHLNMGHVFP